MLKKIFKKMFDDDFCYCVAMGSANIIGFAMLLYMAAFFGWTFFSLTTYILLR